MPTSFVTRRALCAAAALAIACASSCAAVRAVGTVDDPGETAVPQAPGGATPAPVYATIQMLWGRSCGCHADGIRGGLSLASAVSYKMLVGAPAVEQPGSVRVMPGRPDQSYLMCKLTPGCLSDAGETMPPPGSGAPALSPEEVVEVAAWIQGGALPPPADVSR
jgi:hypothetical protein